MQPCRLFRARALILMFSGCCLLVQPGFGQLPQMENAPSLTIRGTVINSVTREPVGHALVYSQDNRFATMTDSEGHFEFVLSKSDDDKSTGSEASLSPAHSTAYTTGPYMLMARKPGFVQPNARTVVVSSAQDQGAKPGSETTIQLVPEALITGRVSLPSSEAAERIQLELYRQLIQDGRARWALAGTVATRSNGEFRFAELEPGSYKLLTRELMDRDPLTFDPNGQLFAYPPSYYPNAIDFVTAGTIELAAGKTFVADLSVARKPYFPIRIGLANASAGFPLRVLVSLQGHRGPGFSLGYNLRDQRIEGMLPNGNYTLEAFSYGPNSSTGVLSITVKGAPVEEPRMVLVPNSSIRVDLKEEFTAPETTSSVSYVESHQNGRNVRVSRFVNVILQPADDFQQEGGAGLRPPTSAKDEALVLENVQPGRYWVQINSYRGYVASATSGGTDLLRHPLVVPVGGNTPAIEITVRDDSAEVQGTIEEVAASSGNVAAPSSLGDSSPQFHVYFVPVPDSTGQFAEVWSAPDGKFNAQLSPGTYRVLAFDRAQDNFEYRRPEAMRAYEAKGTLVRLLAGQKENIRVHLIPTGEE